MVNTPPSLPSTENHIPPTLPSDSQLLILLLSYAVHLSLLVLYLLFSPTYFALFSGDVSPEKLSELCFFSFLNSTVSIQFATLAPGSPLSLMHIFFAFSPSIHQCFSFAFYFHSPFYFQLSTNTHLSSCVLSLHAPGQC